jgi:predicted phage terminase large subunit-like protein
LAEIALLDLVGSDIAAIRMRCLEDPAFFASEVLGYDFFTDLAPFQLEALKADFNNEHILFLAPRGHIKTTILDIVGTMHYLLRHPDDRVLLAASTWDNAKLVLREIVNHYRSNAALHFYFPELKPRTKDEAGNTEQYTLPCRTRVRKEASIETSGPDRIVTGRHYELIRAVDLVVEQNVPPAASFEQIQKVIDYFRKLPFLLDNTVDRARITVDGTRWHMSDLYGMMQKEGGFAHYRRIIIGIQDDAEGRPIEVWKRYPRNKLEQIRGTCLAYWWAANFKNDPLSEQALGFRKEWFKTYDEMPKTIAERLHMRVAITCDLAISDAAKSDRTAIVVTGISQEGDFYVLSLVVGRFTPYETIEWLYNLDSAWHPDYIGVESVAWQKAMIYMLRHEAGQRGRALPIRALVPDASKGRRAGPLMTHAQVRGIYYRSEHQELVEECLRFTPTEDRGHDDIVDALAYRGQDLLLPYVGMVLHERRLTSAPSTTIITGDQLLRLAEVQSENENLMPWEELLE